MAKYLNLLFIFFFVDFSSKIAVCGQVAVPRVDVDEYCAQINGGLVWTSFLPVFFFNI